MGDGENGVIPWNSTIGQGPSRITQIYAPLVINLGFSDAPGPSPRGASAKMVEYAWALPGRPPNSGGVSKQVE